MTAAVPTGNTYDKYASTNPIERRLMSGFFSAIEAALPSEPPARVLEVGVGEGEIAERLRARYPDAAVTVLDLPDERLGSEWRARGLAGVFGDVTALPFPAGAFDLVCAIEVLEHVPDPPAMIREIARVGAATVVLSVPREPIWRMANLARGKYVTAVGNTPGHIQHWGRRGFVDLVGRALDVTSVRCPFPWTVVGSRVRG
ncbi:MAG: class I SAM-dependent methyltransferase [Acidimicrobiia bacterium]